MKGLRREGGGAGGGGSGGIGRSLDSWWKIRRTGKRAGARGGSWGEDGEQTNTCLTKGQEWMAPGRQRRQASLPHMGRRVHDGRAGGAGSIRRRRCWRRVGSGGTKVERVVIISVIISDISDSSLIFFFNHFWGAGGALARRAGRASPGVRLGPERDLRAAWGRRRAASIRASFIS